MWQNALMWYLWLLMWAPGPPQGPNNPFAHPDGPVISGIAQAMDPNVGNKAPGVNGSHSTYQGHSGDAAPNNP